MQTHQKKPTKSDIIYNSGATAEQNASNVQQVTSVGNTTKIEWAEKTWNLVTGCTPVSPGCQNCYAKVFAERFRSVPGHHFENGFDFQLRPERLEQPLHWEKPRRIFVCSMADLFHSNVPDAYIGEVFKTMIAANWHTFIVLTKRADRLVDWIGNNLERVPDNIWIGVTVENQDYVDRIDKLVMVPAKTRFVSFEPLLGDVIVPDHLMAQIDWAIIGGETGVKARKMEAAWVLSLIAQCKKHGVAAFFKKWGKWDAEGQKVGNKRAGRLIDGKLLEEYPHR